MKKILLIGIFVTTLFFTCICETQANDVYKYIFRPKPISLSECEKIKFQYGIPVCTVDGDYWVGAAVACGGVKNLPNRSDFARISEDILTAMIENYDPNYFNEYYYNINKIVLYSDEPYQKKPVDQNATWLAKKWQNWRYDVNFNKIHGYYFSFDTKYTSVSSLYSLNRQYYEYVREEKQRIQDWNEQHPDDKRTLSVDSRYEYMKRKIGSYTSKSLYRDNYDLEAYAICRSDLLK